MIQVERPGRFITFLVVIGLGLALIIALVLVTSAQTQRSGEVVIASGEHASQLWRRLAEEKFTMSTVPWHYHGWRLAAATHIQAGTYHLEEGERIKDVVRRFMTGDSTPDERTITYPEGFTVQQMAERTAKQGITSEDEFIAAANPVDYMNQFSFLAAISPGRDLEGYLFPDTYRLFPDDAAPEVVRRMLTNFDRKLTEELRAEISRQQRTIDEVIIMASIVEREVQTNEDMAKAAGVLWRRVDDGVGLAADATVRYALNKWDDPLTVDDLQIDSPYNTRRYRGLPPGPISNPGLRAILAAIRPEKTDYYYYLSTPAGETIFSKTLDEHNKNKAKYLR